MKNEKTQQRIQDALQFGWEPSKVTEHELYEFCDWKSPDRKKSASFGAKLDGTFRFVRFDRTKEPPSVSIQDFPDEAYSVALLHLKLAELKKFVEEP